MYVNQLHKHYSYHRVGKRKAACEYEWDLNLLNIDLVRISPSSKLPGRQMGWTFKNHQEFNNRMNVFHAAWNIERIQFSRLKSWREGLSRRTNLYCSHVIHLSSQRLLHIHLHILKSNYQIHRSNSFFKITESRGWQYTFYIWPKRRRREKSYAILSAEDNDGSPLAQSKFCRLQTGP